MVISNTTLGQANINRGKKWYDMRDRDGNLPEWCQSQPSIVKDVEFYLESIKVPEIKLVEWTKEKDGSLTETKSKPEVK